ncbi:hypothetical protein vseg_021506 [Gypsophila vaccaria]
MLSVKLVRSLVLGESLTPDRQDDDNNHHHDGQGEDTFTRVKTVLKKRTKMPMLLFLPTKELITDTFRLAIIARDVGMNFNPSNSLSHLLFSWPPSPSLSLSPSLLSQSSLSSNTINNNNNNNNNNHRTSVSSQGSTFTHTSTTTTMTSSSLSTTATLSNEAVPIPFPALSTYSSISLLRSFVTMSKGLFKLVFIDLSANPNPNFGPNLFSYYHDLLNYDAPLNLALFSRVSGKRVRSIDDLSGELAARGWSLFRTGVRTVLPESTVYLFRKMDPNRVRVKAVGCVGECSRVRELRLPEIEFEKAVNLRVLLYILLITDDVFYLA